MVVNKGLDEGKNKALDSAPTQEGWSMTKPPMLRRQQLQVGDDGYANKATYWWLWNKGCDKGSEEDVLTELSCQWLQDKGSDKGNEEDVLMELSRWWLQDKGSEKDAPTKLSQW